MRIASILSGISVLLTTVAYGLSLYRRIVSHLAFLQHLDAIHASHEAPRNPSFVISLFVGTIILVFSFFGGCLLLKRTREVS